MDDGADLDGVRDLRRAVFAAGMVPLLIAPYGGMLADMPVQRTFATARSIEFDALLLAAAPAPPPTPCPRGTPKRAPATPSRPTRG
ncbi:hypothetical protein GCM10027612_61070 [Microbispora bryophytorum subsp. camponoti]